MTTLKYIIKRASLLTLAAMLSLGTLSEVDAQRRRASRAGATPAATTPAATTPAATTPASRGIPGLSSEEKAKRLAELEKQAMELFLQKDFDRALLVLQQIAAMNPSTGPADMMLGKLFAAANIPAGLRHQLECAAQNAPDDPEAFVMLASIAMNEGRVAEATLALGRAQQLLEAYDKSPQRKEKLSLLLLETLASYAEKQQRWRDRLGILQEIEKLVPANLAVQEQIAVTYLNMQDESNAVTVLEKVRSANPSLTPPETAVATYYLMHENLPKAVEFMKKATEKYPHDVQTLVAGAKIHFATGKPDEAMKAAETLLAGDPENPAACVLVGSLLLADEKSAEAIRHFSRALDLDSSSEEAGLGYIRALLLTPEPGLHQEALNVAVQMVLASPQNTSYLVHYAWALYVNGKQEDAIDILSQVIPVWSGSQDEAYILARCLAQQEDNSFARRLLEVTLADSTNFMFRKAAVQLQKSLEATKP